MEVTKNEYDVIQSVKDIVQRKGIAEVHEEKGNYVVVEIKRKLNSKRPME